MRYVMKQKIFTLADSFTIQDEHGQDKAVVNGQLFSFSKKLSFNNMEGAELASIREKLLAWGPTFEIYRADQLAAVVKKKLFTLLHCKFTVDVPGPNDLEAEGDFLDHEYTFTRGGVPVAYVSKQWFTWADTYGVDIADGEDVILILASTVVIDMACHDSNNGSILNT